MSEFIEWTISLAGSPYAVLALYLLAFAESAFLPFPSDVLLMTCVLSAQARGDLNGAVFLAFLATAGSILGSALGYIIGNTGGTPLIKKLFSPERVESVHNTYDKYEKWTLGIAGFTPIPYSVFTLSAGAFYIDFTEFILVSTASRGLRYLLEALLVFHLGKPMLDILQRHYPLISLALIVLFTAGIIYYRWKKAQQAQ